MRPLPPAARFVLAGIASGAFAALVTQPADTIKTRMQVPSWFCGCRERHNYHYAHKVLMVQAFVNVESHPEYTSIASTARHLIQTQGIASLWTGIAPRLVRLCGATIILQVVRTQMIALIEGSRTDESQMEL